MLEVTLGVGIVTILVLLVQPLTAKFFKRKWRYWVWLVLAIRLLVPIDLSLPSFFEVELPRNEIVVTDITSQTPVTPPEMQQVPIIPETPDEPVAEPTNRPVYVRPVTTVKTENEKTIPITLVLGTVWITVAVAMFSYQIVTHLLFFRRTNRFNHTADAETLELLNRVCSEMGITQKVDVFYNGKIQSPLLVGFFKPRILLPKFPNKTQDIEMILRHELMHFKRRDIWYKLLVRAALSLHWFNPMVWIMAKVADEDLEKACDEDVVKNQNENFRHTYCQSILHVVRMQKTKEPALAAGFASRPSDLRNRFGRILDMTKRRAGKTALIIVACITVACTVFVGCELGGVIDVSSNIGPSDTSSETDERSPYSIDLILENSLKLPISKDGELLLIMKREYDYTDFEVIAEDTRSVSSQITYQSPERTVDRETVYKTSLFLLDTAQGSRVVLFSTEKVYEVIRGLVDTQTVDYCRLYASEVGEFSADDLKGAEFVFTEDASVCAVYLPERNSALQCFDADHNGTLEEVRSFDKNDPLLVAWKLDAYISDSALKEMSRGYVAATNTEGERYLAYLDRENDTLTRLSDRRLLNTDTGNLSVMGETHFAVYLENAVEFYDVASDSPLTPIAVITSEDIGFEFATLRGTEADRNNPARFVQAFKRTSDNQLGFMTFDTDGNLTHSFLTELYAEDSSDIYQADFVDNIVYFTNITDEYLKVKHSKYAVDVRKGKNNTPQLTTYALVDELNISLDEFRYDVSARAYPFVLCGEESLGMRGYAVSASTKDGFTVNYYIREVAYDATSKNLTVQAVCTGDAHITGRLSIEDEGAYLIPYETALLPIPSDSTGQAIKLEIATKDFDTLKEYLSGFEKENLTVSINNLLIERRDGTLSYTAEINEIYNGNYDRLKQTNETLEILKLYGAVTDGEARLIEAGANAINSYIKEPLICATPVSPLYYEDYTDPRVLLDWYTTYTMRETLDKLSFDELAEKTEELYNQDFIYKAQEFEVAIEKFFGVSADELRKSRFYDENQNRYTYYKAQPVLPLETIRLAGTVRHGDTLQVKVYLENMVEHVVITAVKDGDSYRFVDVQRNSAFTTPSVFVVHLFEKPNTTT